MLAAAAVRKNENSGQDVAYDTVSRASSDGTSSSSESDSSSDDTDSESDSDESVSSEYLNDLLVAARKNMSEKAMGKRREDPGDVMMLSEHGENEPMPPLDPGPSLPQPYLKLSERYIDKAVLLNDPEVERVKDLATTASIASTLPPPPELSKKTGQPLTKAEKKALKEATAGAGWFDLPAPPPADLPRLAREVDAMRLRNALDPKRFYRKEDTKAGPLPKYFAIGHIVTSSTPFGGLGRDDLPRAARKQNIVDELMADDEARTYAKRKFSELQSIRDERGRGTYRRKFARRQKRFW